MGLHLGIVNVFRFITVCTVYYHPTDRLDPRFIDNSLSEQSLNQSINIDECSVQTLQELSNVFGKTCTEQIVSFGAYCLCRYLCCLAVAVKILLSQ